VMDRYAVCQYASIRAHGGHRWERFARLAYRVFPAPQLTILLTVDPAEAYRRIERRGTDHEELSYLVAADAAYRSLPEYAGFVVIDANQSPAEVTRAIQAQLARWVPGVPGAGAPTGMLAAVPPAATSFPPADVAPAVLAWFSRPGLC